jgi:hypothetical protein
MDSSRSTSSRQDTTARLSRDASNRSRPLDLTRPSTNPEYDRAYSTRDAAGREGSSGGYDRGYSTRDAAQPGSGYQERQTNDATEQVGPSGGYDRSYSTYDASQASLSRDLTPSRQQGETTSQQEEQDMAQQIYDVWKSKRDASNYVDHMRESGMIDDTQYDDAYYHITKDFIDKTDRIKDGEN